ncbi:MAG: metalloregulator ArsR/SmtB family transcription factor [Polyangiaceae bacterium]
MPANSARIASAAKRNAPVFFALGDETRLRLVSQLGRGEAMSIAALTHGTTVTRQAITKHLRVLEGAGLVRGARHGREQMWQLAPRKLDDACRCLELISQQWDEALLRLKTFVEAGEAGGTKER